MTLGRKATSGVEILITRLSALDGEADWQRPSGEVVPWFMVSDAPSGVSDKVTDRGIYSVHTFHPDYWEARRYSFLADDLILSMGPPIAPPEDIVLGDGRIVRVGTVEQSLRPHYSKYSDDLARFKGNYVLELPLL